jgi:S1-C subfamily serine protease
MKYLRVFLSCFLLLLFSSTSIATEESPIKQKILKHFQKLIAKSVIEEPSKNIQTRSPEGSRLYKRLANGVVLVATEDVIGSGIIISNSGLVITNWHVVENKSYAGILLKKTAFQRKISEKDILFADVLKIDPIRDLALLKISSPPSNLTILTLGTLPQVEVGEDVFAISHPEGLLWSYTEGVISQIHPNYTIKTEDGKTHQATYIQTQTPISPGSSGGALFDYNGKVIGVLTAGLGSGLNFAIAVNEVQGFILSALEKR